MAERKVVPLRIRPELYEALQRWAQDEFRSVNGHLEYLLHRAVREAGREMKPRRAAKSPRGTPGPQEESPAGELPAGDASEPG